MIQTPPLKRGRPKTLNRDQVLHVALMQYWANDPLDVSINDICALSGASKPGIYREFGNDDGLKSAVLSTYWTLAVEPFLSILESNQPFNETIAALIDFMTQDRAAMELPPGCLFVMMRAQRWQLGTSTGAKLDHYRQQFLARVSDWIERSKTTGAIRQDMPTKIIALYFDAQHAGAMRMQKEGVSGDHVVQVLQYGFTTLRA